MSIETAIAYALAMGLFAASPGPGVFAVVSQAVARGAGPAFVMLTGIIIGDITFLIAAAAGLGILAEKLGTFFAIIKYVGAAYLIWLGWQAWRIQGTADPASNTPTRFSLLGGFSISISNPKVMVFYLAFLPSFLDLTTITAADIGLLASITTVNTYLILGIYIVGASKLRQTISRPRPQKWFNRLSGAVMASAGVLVAARN